MWSLSQHYNVFCTLVPLPFLCHITIKALTDGIQKVCLLNLLRVYGNPEIHEGLME